MESSILYTIEARFLLLAPNTQAHADTAHPSPHAQAQAARINVSRVAYVERGRVCAGLGGVAAAAVVGVGVRRLLGRREEALWGKCHLRGLFEG